MSNSRGTPVIRPLGPDDLRRCAELALDRGWWPERGKWALLLENSDAWGIDAPDGDGLAGSVVLTRWGGGCAGLGMMLTASRYGGHGFGRALMEHAIGVAGEDTAVSLFATSSGRPLYDKLGFKPVRNSVAFRGTFREPQASDGRRRGTRGESASAAQSERKVRVADKEDLPAILALDRAAYGADRERILAHMPGFAERLVVLEDGDGIVGYAAAWRTEVYTVIGPLVAKDGAGARQLVADLGAHSVAQIRLDLDPDRPELPAWLRTCGLLPTERTTVMTLGKITPRGIPEHVYTPISVAMA